MFSDAEMKLLAVKTAGFPLLAATQNAWRSCSTCKHAGINVHAMLRTAVSSYRSDAGFLKLCKGLFGLPCNVAGVYLEDAANG